MLITMMVYLQQNKCRFLGVLDYFRSVSRKLFRSILILQPSSITNSLLAIDCAFSPCFLIHCSPPPRGGKIITFIVHVRKWGLESFTSLTQTGSASKWPAWDLDAAAWHLSTLSEPMFLVLWVSATTKSPKHLGMDNRLPTSFFSPQLTIMF